MLFPQKNGEKSPKTVEKPRFARNRRILQETAQDFPGAPQFSMRCTISCKPFIYSDLHEIFLLAPGDEATRSPKNRPLSR